MPNIPTCSLCHIFHRNCRYCI